MLHGLPCAVCGKEMKEPKSREIEQFNIRSSFRLLEMKNKYDKTIYLRKYKILGASFQDFKKNWQNFEESRKELLEFWKNEKKGDKIGSNKLKEDNEI